jgi:hypothetical protein
MGEHWHINAKNHNLQIVKIFTVTHIYNEHESM